MKLTAKKKEAKMLAKDGSWSRRVSEGHVIHYLVCGKGLRGGMAAEIYYGAMKPKRNYGASK